MLKSKVIRTIVASCRDPVTHDQRAPSSAGNRSPAAGGGLAGAVPNHGAQRRRADHGDPRLGHSLEVRRPRRRGSKRG